MAPDNPTESRARLESTKKGKETFKSLKKMT
jgi:hypothetical protein